MRFRERSKLSGLRIIDAAGQAGNAGGWPDISVQKLRRHHTRRETDEAE